MDQELLKSLARELAQKVNKVVNIPLIREEDEEAFFEIVILMMLDLVLGKLGGKYKLR